MNTPNILFYLVVLVTLAGIFRIARRAVDDRFARNALGIALAWLALTGVAAAAGFFERFDAMPPRLLLLVVPGMVLCAMFAVRRGVPAALADVSQNALVGVQAFRILMELCLWLLYRDGRMPVQMTFEGRNFDLAVGVTAALLWLLMRTGRTLPRRAIVAWNAAGFAVLINTVITGLLSAPTPLRVFMNEPANTEVAGFPFCWLPALVVPFALALHVLSIRKALATPGAG